MKRVSKTLLLSGLLILAISTGCKKEAEPSLYDPNYVSGPQPVIERMEPADSAYAGVGTIKVFGKNFVPNKPYNDYNQLYFDNIMANILDMTTTEITVASPNYIGDSIKVKIAVRGADKFSEPVLYKLKAAVDTTFARLDDFKQSHIAYAIATDSKGTVYVFTKVETSTPFGQILKVNRKGEPTIWVEQTNYLKANSFKVGPDNRLYVAFALGRLKQVVAIDLNDSTAQQTVATFSRAPYDMDFDQDGNLWVVTQNELVKVKPDGSKESMTNFTAFMSALRIYEQGGTTYVYVAGVENNTQYIWRFPINADGTIGAQEEVLNSGTATWLVKENGTVAEINGLTFSADGKMYIATNLEPDPLVIYDLATGIVDYQYPGLIKPKLNSITWFGNIIYVTQSDPGESVSNVLRIDVGKTGAPYYGRP